MVALVAGAFVVGRLSGKDRPRRVDTEAVRQAQELATRLDALEAELTHGAALVEHQRDLARRHEQVTAIACESLTRHATETSRIAKASERRRRARAALVPTNPEPDTSPAAASEGDAAPLEGGGGETSQLAPEEAPGVALASRAGSSG